MARSKTTTSTTPAPEPLTPEAIEAAQAAGLVPSKRLVMSTLGMPPGDQRDDTMAAMIAGYGRHLAAAGERPWFEVWYPAPDHLSDEEAAAWLGRQPDTFDAVELVDYQTTKEGIVGGTIRTLPPYAELIAAGSK